MPADTETPPPDIFAALIPPSQGRPDDQLARAREYTAKSAGQVIGEGYRALCDTYNALSKLLNENPQKLTPRQAAAALGPRGAALLALAAHARTLVEEVARVTGRDASKDLVAGRPGLRYEPRADGTLDVTEEV